MLMNAGKIRTQAGKSHRRMWVTSSFGVAVLLLSMSGWAMWRSHSKQKLLASVADDPRKIREAVDQGTITRQEARDAFEQAMEARMNKTMDEYFVLPAGKERDKYLDKMIDEMEARRREWQQRATTQPTTRPNREDRADRGDRPATQPNDRARRMATRMDSTPPERRAKMAEFRAAMAARMAARGIQGGPGRGGFGGWGGRGGGGGGGGRNR